jgi:hypothetical protein
MNNDILKGTDSKILLVGKIKGLSSESKHTRQLIIKAKSKFSEKKIWRHAYIKRVIGSDIRHHLLAYAFMRGKPYHSLEKKCQKGFGLGPNADTILQIVHAHLPFRQYKENWTLDKVNAWLAGAV